MTFAKCIGGEPERVFASPAAREMPPGKLKMRHLLGWTRGGSNRSAASTPPASPHRMAQSPVVRDVKSDAASRTPPMSPAAASKVGCASFHSVLCLSARRPLTRLVM